MKHDWRKLHARRPRRPFVTWSLRGFVLIVVTSWLVGDFQIVDFWNSQRWSNVQRFFHDVRPYPLQDQPWDMHVAWQWAFSLWQDGGQSATIATLALSLAAIVGAGFFGALLSLAAARNFACPHPFLPGGRPVGRGTRWAWSLLVLVTRSTLVFIRSVPEYVWAFLFLALLGPTAWPLVLALVFHNTGILGKLSSEVIENADQTGPGALRALGAGRTQIVLGSLFPQTLPRFLLYFFYRWETCVREATVLGMLGISSLGFMIVDARSRNHYDELMFFILLGAGLVLLGDLASAVVRRVIRQA